MTSLLKRFAGKKFFIFCTSFAGIAYLYTELAKGMDRGVNENGEPLTHPLDPAMFELTGTVIWALAILGGLACIGQGLGDMGKGFGSGAGGKE